MGGDGGGGGSALKDIMSGTVAGIAQVVVGEARQRQEKKRPPHCMLSDVTRVEVPQKIHLLSTFLRGTQTGAHRVAAKWDSSAVAEGLWSTATGRFADEPGRAHVALLHHTIRNCRRTAAVAGRYTPIYEGFLFPL